MYLITLVHTVPYSICILWRRFVSADVNPLSAMRTKAVLEIKTGSSDFSIRNSPKHKFITFPQYFLVVSSFSFKTSIIFSQLSRRSNVASFPQPWHFYPLHSFLITCSLSSGIFILSAFASPAIANLSSHRESHALVEAASLEFNTFFCNSRLGSHDCAVPWPLTTGA